MNQQRAVQMAMVVMLLVLMVVQAIQ